MKKILVLNGPNINLLGTREPYIYGSDTYADLEQLIYAAAQEFDIQIEIIQSNHEGVLIDAIHHARHDCHGIVINPAAYTHTSIALYDALKAVALPAVEVHISNLSERESFRHVSYIADACVKTIAGHGIEGYRKAIQHLAELLH